MGWKALSGQAQSLDTDDESCFKVSFWEVFNWKLFYIKYELRSIHSTRSEQELDEVLPLVEAVKPSDKCCLSDFWMFVCADVGEPKTRGIRTLLYTQKLSLEIVRRQAMNGNHVLRRTSCAVNDTRKLNGCRSAAADIHGRRPQENWSVRRHSAELFKIHKGNKGNYLMCTDGWSVTEKRPKRPFVCHTPPINQKVP